MSFANGGAQMAQPAAVSAPEPQPAQQLQPNNNSQDPAQGYQPPFTSMGGLEYSPEELAIILKMMTSGIYTEKDVASRLHRTPKAIRIKWYKMQEQIWNDEIKRTG